MRRNVGCHPYSNPGGTVEQNLGNACREYEGFLLGTVEVVAEINCFRVDVAQHGVASESCQATLGVTHRSGRIVVNGAEVAVAVDQAFPHGEILSHPHQGVVNRCISVRVILAQHLPHDAGAFAEGSIGSQAQFVHGVENASVNGLETVPGIWERPTDNYAHGVFQVRSGHLITQIRRDYPRLRGAHRLKNSVKNLNLTSINLKNAIKSVWIQ